jgi:hypothetical protein
MKTQQLNIRGALLTCGLFVSSLCVTSVFAQQDSTGSVPAEIPNKAKGGGTKFLLAGKAQLSWTQTQSPGTLTSHTFYPNAFMLMPLVKLTDRLFLDAQVEVDANATGGAAINLNEMIVYFKASPYMSIFAGNFSPKYGLYMGVLDDFTNRYCTNPIGMNRGPATQTGIGIQGGLQAGYTKLSYQLYLANGPQLIVDSTTTGSGNMTGQLSYGSYADNNKDKCVGGSIGFLPLSNSNLQIDVSGQYTAKTGNAGTPFESVSSTSWAVDLNYYHLFNPLMVRVLAEYNNTSTQNFNYPWFSDSTKKNLLVPAFNNQLSGWFCGATVRLAGVNNRFVSNLELGGRIGAYTPPQYTVGPNTIAPWGQTPIQQTTICLTYWFTWKTPFNLAYDVLTPSTGPAITSYTARLIYFF